MEIASKNERRQAARDLAEQLLHEPSPAIAQALAQVCALSADVNLRQGILQALSQVGDAPRLNLIWEVWEKTRSIYLENLLMEKGIPATYPLMLQILSVLKLEKADWILQADPEIVEPLLAAAVDGDPAIHTGAVSALSSLAKPEAQEEVCRWVIEYDHPIARQAALQGDFAPRQAQRRALYYLLSEQWERYQALDFDTSLLRAVHQAADEALRDKLARLARQAGWSGYTHVIAGRHTQRFLSSLTSLEWDVILTILGRNQRFAEAWQLAQAAPPLWSARLLQSLHADGWLPEGEEAQAAFTQLSQAALGCLEQGAPVERLPAAPLLMNGHSRPIKALAFSPNGAWLASGGLDRGVSLWRPENASLQAWLDGHTAAVVSLAFNRNGSRLASGSVDRSIRLWHTEEKTCLHILGGHASEVPALAFSPSAALLASGDSVTVRLWDAEQGQLLHLMPAQEWGIFSLAFSPDGKLLVSGHTGNALNFWSVPEGEKLGLLKEKVACWDFAARSKGGGWELASSSSYGAVRLWEIPSGQLLKTLEGRTDGEQLAVSPDGRLLAASELGSIHLWRLSDGEPLNTLQRHTERLARLVFSPDGGLLASSAQDGSLCLWQVPEGRLVGCFNLSAAPCGPIFSPSGNALVYADQERLYLLPLHDLGRWFRLPVGQAGDLAALQQMLDSSPPGDIQPGIKPHNRAADLAAYPSLARCERDWLAFTLALYRWRGRFDIEIDQPIRQLVIGDFDIEISG